jgi:hypothetical protein
MDCHKSTNAGLAKVEEALKPAERAAYLHPNSGDAIYLFCRIVVLHLPR